MSQGSTHGRRLNQTPHRSFGHSGRPRRGRSIEKDQKLNMDAQDAQDKQDEGLLRGELTPAMIRCGRPQFSKRDPPGSAGVPPAPSLAQPRPSPPLGSTGNGAMALLRPGRCGSRRQGGCRQHRTEAQRRPKGQGAGGTPALPGKAKTGNIVYTFHQCINHSLRVSSWITLLPPSRTPFPTLGGSLSILLQPLSGPSPFFVALRGYVFLSEARPR